MKPGAALPSAMRQPILCFYDFECFDQSIDGPQAVRERVQATALFLGLVADHVIHIVQKIRIAFGVLSPSLLPFFQSSIEALSFLYDVAPLLCSSSGKD